MKITQKFLLNAATCAVFGASGAGVAQAAELGGVEIHGYGNQNYLRSPSLPYKLSDGQRDSFDETTVALLFVAPLDEKSKVWTQIHMTQEKIRLDWAFVDYQLTGSLMGRLGRIKLPLGLYNEIIDAKFLQLSTEAPFLYQEAVGLTAEAYQGLGLVYDLRAAGGDMSLDFFLGQPSRDEEEPALTPKRLVGGRLTYKTPLPGLRVMASAYRSSVQDATDPLNPVPVSQRAWILSGEYKTETIDLKSEYGASKSGDAQRNAWYVQGGYNLSESWQPFVRYDQLVTDKAQKSDPSYYQKSVVLGLNYKVSSSLSIRAENHFNRGYALPVASENVAAGSGKTSWNFMTASVNFIF